METKAPGIIAAGVVCIVFSTLFVFARLYSQISTRLFRTDDGLLIFAWLINVALTIITFLDLRHGTGHHTWDIPASGLTPHYKLQYATGILYYMVLPITKLGICLLYLRIVNVDRRSRILILCLIAYLVLTGIGLTGYIMNECTPISAYWNDQFGPQCWRRRSVSNAIFFLNAASNTITDLCIIAIVIPVIWKLQMPDRQKYLLYGVVCFGWLAVISSVIRMIIVSRVLKSTDPAWEAADMDIWSCVECNTSLICAAAPCTRQFINKVRPHLLPSYIRRATMRRSELQGSTGDQKSWPMKTIGNGKSRVKSQYAMSDTALAEADSIGHIDESRPESLKHSLEVQHESGK